MPDEQFCVVCGQGSHRTDWVNKFKANGTLYVACDNHSTDQVQKAIASAEKDKAAAAVVPAKA